MQKEQCLTLSLFHPEPSNIYFYFERDTREETDIQKKNTNKHNILPTILQNARFLKCAYEQWAKVTWVTVIILMVITTKCWYSLVENILVPYMKASHFSFLLGK